MWFGKIFKTSGGSPPHKEISYSSRAGSKVRFIRSLVLELGMNGTSGGGSQSHGWTPQFWSILQKHIYLGQLHHFITTSNNDRNPCMMVNKGNHPQISKQFRLVNDYSLPYPQIYFGVAPFLEFRPICFFWETSPLKAVSGAVGWMDIFSHDRDFSSGKLAWLLKMAKDIVSFPIKHGDFP